MSGGFYSVRTLARYLGVSERTITYMVARGEIASYKVGGQRRFSMDDVQAYLASVRESVAR